jgi:hypothetical protein
MASQSQKPRSPLDETDEEDEQPDEPGKPPLSPDEQIAAALSQLTKLAAKLAKNETKDSLDKVLDLAGKSGTGSSDSSGSSATRALKAALREKPEKISGPIKARMKELNHGTLTLDPATAASSSPPNALYWLEHRSRVQAYRSHVLWTWLTAHVAQCLMEGKVAEAEARVLLMLAMAEQVSLDRGSWTLAYELSLTSEPPMAAFEAHKVESSRVPHTQLLDERMIEVAHARLKAIDDLTERRRRLDSQKPPTRDNGDPPERGPKKGGNPKDSNGKAKAAAKAQPGKDSAQ